MRRAALVAICLAAAVVPARAAPGEDAPRPGDSITWIEGGSKRTRTGVVVESADIDHVVFAQAGKRTTVDGSSVIEVRWGDAPAEFDAATAALRSGNADGAASGFEAVLLQRRTPRGWLVEYANTGLGEALLAVGARDAAGVERAALVLTAARDANPRSLVLDRILGGLGRAELLRGRPDAALDAADALESAAKSAKRPAWEADAALLRAQALDEKNDDAGALRVLADLAESSQAAALATKDIELAARLHRAAVRASVRRTWLLVAIAESSRKPDAAERVAKLVTELTAKWSDDPEIDAAATCATGAMLLAGGDAKKALRKFQEVEVVHFDVFEEAARALRYEAICYERLGNTARRAEAMRLLTETYPGTEAERKAR